MKLEEVMGTKALVRTVNVVDGHAKRDFRPHLLVRVESWPSGLTVVRISRKIQAGGQPKGAVPENA